MDDLFLYAGLILLFISSFGIGVFCKKSHLDRLIELKNNGANSKATITDKKKVTNNNTENFKLYYEFNDYLGNKILSNSFADEADFNSVEKGSMTNIIYIKEKPSFSRLSNKDLSKEIRIMKLITGFIFANAFILAPIIYIVTKYF